ncbi:MAG: response regulator [Candidatus Omnitrophota bacterium]
MKKAKVLLVDDQPDFLEPISFLLRSEGYEVLLANGGIEAIEMIKSDNPDIVFLDIVMPEVDGLETLSRIRSFNKLLPVVILTAEANEENRLQAQKLGVAGFFPKRGNVWQLPGIIVNILKDPKKMLAPQDDTKTAPEK